MTTRLASSVRSAVNNRAVSISVTPRPLNIGESREIYRLLARFGEVDYYKNLLYDLIPTPGQAHIIYRDESAAQKCIERSPIRFRMGPARSSDEAFETDDLGETQVSVIDDALNSSLKSRVDRRTSSSRPFRVDQTRFMSTRSLQGLPKPHEELVMPRSARRTREELPVSRLFQIIARPAAPDFRAAIERGHYYGRFPNDWRSVPNEDLKRKVPYKAMANLDWRQEVKSQSKTEQDMEQHLAWMRSNGYDTLRSMYEQYLDGQGQNVEQKGT